MPQNPRTYTGEWICARDHSHNSGPYCTLCGAPRPRTAASAAANTAQHRPLQQQYAQQPAQRPVQQYAQQSAQRPVQQYAQQPVQQRPAERQYAQQPEQTYAPNQPYDFDFASRPVSQPVSQEPESTYTGKFAKKTSQPPEFDQMDSADAEYDADLLEAILREAEQGDGE